MPPPEQRRRLVSALAEFLVAAPEDLTDQEAQQLARALPAAARDVIVREVQAAQPPVPPGPVALGPIQTQLGQGTIGPLRRRWQISLVLTALLLLGRYILFVFVPWAFITLAFSVACLKVGLRLYLLYFCVDYFFTPADDESWKRKEWLAEELNRCVSGRTEVRQRIDGSG